MTGPVKPISGGLGKAMIYVAWIVVLGILVLFFQNVLDRQRNPNRTLVTYNDTAGRPSVVLKQNRAGHYLGSGTVNGHPVEFLVDTGASDIAIPLEMADRLGLRPGMPRQYQTANGFVTAFTTHIDELTIGPLVIHNVRASLNPGMGSMEILLGMSLLKDLEFTQRGDTLTLTPGTP
ncbi:MAG: TIGR02281 family clan AA aspartic protease [Gammaproteobacteria bacterium]|nr:TIGR02281 family clan AA aspartic protease [Gammaproteobacteria bacterium]